MPPRDITMIPFPRAGIHGILDTGKRTVLQYAGVRTQVRAVYVRVPILWECTDRRHRTVAGRRSFYLLEQLRHGTKTIGLKQTARLVETDGAAIVFIAQDADERVVGRLRDLCVAKGIEVVSAESMKVLGKACGIDVGAAVAAILKD
jgi:large subunit ribosomal protein L7A